MGAEQHLPALTRAQASLIRQLLRDTDAADAKDLFAPVAYSPHFPREKRRNLEIMDKIKAGDGKGALVMLEEDEKKRQKAKR